MEERFAKLAQVLPDWYAAHRRDLPWRRDREPYHVWLSEIMLQQTRVEAVKGYYLRFLEALPTVEALAHADPDQLHKLWEGLGYYTRVRNLQKAARQILDDHGGVFPTNHKEVLALAGIGDYTAGAICSICFEHPTPAVDGNVLRVTARVDASYDPITDQKTKKAVSARLAEVYPQGRCGDFTQSLMELGATVCVPNGAPHCDLCPCRDFCQAHAHGCQMELPVKAAKKERRVEELTVFLLRCGDQYAVVRRPETGLLAGLWAFPHVAGRLSPQAALDTAAAWGVHPRELLKIVEKSHIFTHVRWDMQGVYLTCGEAAGPFRWVTAEEVREEVGLPTAFRQFWEDESSLL